MRWPYGDTASCKLFKDGPCGVMKYVVLQLVSGNVPARVFQFPSRPDLVIDIGDSGGASIVLLGPTVAAIQARLTCTLVGGEEHLLLEDMSGQGGLSVNSEPVESSFLSPGDVVGIGSSSLTYWLEETSDGWDDGGAPGPGGGRGPSGAAPRSTAVLASPKKRPTRDRCH